jgi:hypothetical protein
MKRDKDREIDYEGLVHAILEPEKSQQSAIYKLEKQESC